MIDEDELEKLKDILEELNIKWRKWNNCAGFHCSECPLNDGYCRDITCSLTKGLDRVKQELGKKRCPKCGAELKDEE